MGKMPNLSFASVYSGDNISHGLAVARVKYSPGDRPSEHTIKGR